MVGAKQGLRSDCDHQGRGYRGAGDEALARAVLTREIDCVLKQGDYWVEGDGLITGFGFGLLEEEDSDFYSFRFAY